MNEKPLHGFGVIFDMDGVLVDSLSAHLESWRMLAAEMSRSITDAQFAATFGRTGRDIIRDLFSIVDDEGVRRCDERKESLYRELICKAVPEMPGARELVASLHMAGASIAVGSSGPPENVELVCRAMDLNRQLSACVTGADVSRGKPDPQVFLLASERLELPPSRCLVIEDAPPGIDAAHHAKMPCIALIGSFSRDQISHADTVVESLREITSDLVLRNFATGK
ncbi:MAG: HAD family phosphatase [Planctomycetes bacterium]|nr:HAD family phosphatase [Planctomycetota bacterium]